VLVALGACIALLGVYAALGGGSYQPAAVADPCQPRVDPADAAGGISGALEHALLSSIDNAACKLGVSREELVIALRSESDFEQLAAESGTTPDAAARVVTDALGAAIAAAEERGTLPGFVAGLLRSVTEHVKPWDLLSLVDRLGGLVS
jgi:hypothetical protein